MPVLEHPEKFNVELAQRTLDFVERYPEKHNQGTILESCGSAGCIAGWVCSLGGVDWRDTSSTEARILLGCSRDEVMVFFEDMDEESAKETVRDYIAQGLEARLQSVVEPEREKVNA